MQRRSAYLHGYILRAQFIPLITHLRLVLPPPKKSKDWAKFTTYAICITLNETKTNTNIKCIVKKLIITLHRVVVT